MALYEHQSSGADYLTARRRGYLGDVPGLGKTYTIAEALKRRGVTSPLIVCPAIVKSHWVRVTSDFGLLASVRSYDQIVRGGAEMRDRFVNDMDALVLDEAHYLKHASAQRTKLLLGKDGYARRMPIVYAASGTPISKNPAELWTVLASMFPGVAAAHKIGSYADFVARFCTTRRTMARGRWFDKILPELRNEAEYREILDQIMLRRTLDDVGLDVPPLDWQVVRLDGEELPTTNDTVHYELLTKRGATLEAIASEPHVARMRRRLGELKAAPVVEMLCSQLDNCDEKVVVFAHHRNVLDLLRTGLRRYGQAYIDGDTPPATREREIDRFQNDGASCRVFIGQTIACQTGITLTAARRVVLVEPDWTAVVNHQAGHRIARIGQTADRCIAQMIALADTLDEAIVGQNVRETKLVGSIEGKAA